MNMYEDMRGFLDRLSQENELIRVKREVSTKYEIAAVQKKVQNTINKALFFEKVQGHTMPVVTNIIGTRKRVALALNIPQDKILEEWTNRVMHPRPVRRVSDGPCKEVIVKGDDVDLTKLPIVTHTDGDAGAYITAGAIAIKKDEGKANLSYNRMQFVNRRKLRVRMMPPGSDLGVYHKKHEDRGEPMEAAVCIGIHPHLMFAAATKLPIDEDEYEFAGALRQSPIEVVQCETIDVEVPADAEIVIEGKVLPHVREDEGPFGEFTDSFVPMMKNHVFEVTAITHRENPIYQNIYPGGKEDLNLLGLPIETQVYKAAKKYATVKDVFLTQGSNGFTFNCVVSIQKQNEFQPKNVLLAALATHPWVKICTVVDDDVKPDDSADVFWAISNRCRPDDGIFIIPGMPSYTREDVRVIHKGKVGIDATYPIELKQTFRRRIIPGEEKIQLEDYIEK